MSNSLNEDERAAYATTSLVGISEERFRSYFELGLIGMAITSPSKGIVEVNDEICKILGYERDELLKKTWAELTHPDDLNADLAQFNRVMAGESDGYSLDKRWVRKDGQIIDATISVKVLRCVDGSVDYFVALLQDITDRKRSEEALKESQRRLEEAQRLAHVGHWERDLRTGVITWSDEIYRILGLERQVPPPTAWEHMIHPEDRERISLAIEKAQRSIRRYDVEYRIVRPDGEVRFLHSQGDIIRDEHGELCRAFGVAQDITRRKHAEDALRRSEDRIRLIIDTIPVMAWVLRPDGVVEFLNQRWMDYAGLSLEQYAEEPTRPVHPEDIPRVMEKWLANMAAGKPNEDELRLRRADGEYRWFLVRNAPLRDDHGNLVKWYGVSIDIEERKRAEEERARLVGEVINVQEAERRRIAQDLHDQLKGDLAALNWEVDSIRQRVTGVLRSQPSENLDALKGILDSHGPLKELEKLCNQLVEAVDDIVWTLRPPELDDSFPVVLKDFLDRWSGRYKIKTEFASTCPDDLRLESRIERALYRIIQEGLTNIRRHAEAKHVILGLECDKERVRIYLKDNGRGFNVQAVKNDSGKDRGLGLRGMEERVALLGGRINFTSAPNEGTEVIVDVPLHLKDRSIDNR